MASKQKLSVAIKANGTNVTAMARALGIPVTSMHSCLQRDAYPPEILQEVLKYASIPFSSLDALRQKFEFKLSPSRKRSIPSAPRMSIVAKVGGFNHIVTNDDLQTLTKIQAAAPEVFTLELMMDIIRRLHT